MGYQRILVIFVINLHKHTLNTTFGKQVFLKLFRLIPKKFWIYYTYLIDLPTCRVTCTCLSKAG